jgi:hypothetical protein
MTSIGKVRSSTHMDGYAVYHDLAGVQCAILIRPFPVLPKEHECDVVRHQQRRNPECGNPVGWSHVGLRSVDCGQSYSIEQVQGSFDVEDPH